MPTKEFLAIANGRGNEVEEINGQCRFKKTIDAEKERVKELTEKVLKFLSPFNKEKYFIKATGTYELYTPDFSKGFENEKSPVGKGDDQNIGKFCSNNGTLAFVDENGDYWLCKKNDEAEKILLESGYKKGSFYVPHSNDGGEWLIRNENNEKSFLNEFINIVNNTGCEELIKISKKIKSKKDVEKIKHEGNPILIIACLEGETELVDFLIKNGANIHIKGNKLVSPLYTATDKGFPDIVDLLIKAGADPDAGDVYGNKPIGIANLHHSNRIVRILKKALANNK